MPWQYLPWLGMLFYLIAPWQYLSRLGLTAGRSGCEGLGLRRARRRVMNGGLLRVTRAGANEPGLSMCVMSDSVHSKFHVLREPGLSDGPRRQSVTLAGAASDGGPLRVFLERKLCEIRAGHSSSVKSDPRPLATPGTVAVAWPCVKQRRRQHLLLQGLHPSLAGRRWFSCGPQVGEGSSRRG